MVNGFSYSLQQVEELVTREFGWNGQMSGDNSEFVCYCPVHGDQNASLHVGLKNGSILMNCMSHGCNVYKHLSDNKAWPQQMESRAAAEKADKEYEKKYPERAQAKFKWNSIPVSAKKARDYAKALRNTMEFTEKDGSKTKLKRTLTHVYADGDTAHSVVARYDGEGHKKRIFQYSYGWYDEHDEAKRPTDPDKPQWQIKGWSSETKHMLYALDVVRANVNATVVVVEGEKAADFGNSTINGRYPEYVFTTFKGGTQAVALSDWSPLEGRDIIVLPDADSAGVLAGQEVYNQLKGIAASVSVVDILAFDVPAKWDIADYAERDETMPKFLDVIGSSGAPPTPPPPADGGDSGGGENDDDDEGVSRRLVFEHAKNGSHYRECVEWFNQRYGFLVEGGRMNVVVLDNLKNNPENAVIPEQVFHSAVQNVRIQKTENGATTPASKYWATSNCLKFEKAAITPHKPRIFKDEEGRPIINLWQGFDAETMDQTGSCQKFLDHLNFVCSGETAPDELHEFILIFLARMVQEPHKRQGAILLFRGEQGSGKSIIGEYLRRMVGNKASMTVNKLDRITGQFNSQLSGKILCRVEEAKIPKNEHYEALKDLSTNPYFTMEAKGKTQVTRENYIHFIFTGNYEYMAPVAEKERRLVPVDVPSDHIYDQSYFNPLVEEMEGGGPGALFKYLKEYQLPKKFLPIPQSNALSNQKKQTRSFSAESMFLDWYAKTLKNKGLQSGPQGPSFLPWRQGEEHDRVIFWDTFNAWQIENMPQNKRLTRRFFYRFFEDFQFGTGRVGRVIDNNPKGRFASRYSGTQLLTFPDLQEAKDTFMEHVANDETYDVYSKDDAQQSFIKEKEHMSHE